MDSIELKSRAKINLTLDITGKRDDGYHFVEMVMQQIDLYDNVRISLKKHSKGINLKTNLPYLPSNDTNTAYKAAYLMSKVFYIDRGIDISINKHIPVSAGLAGGSANAAAVIVGLDKVLNLGLSSDEMMRLGLEIGADVPFCIGAKTAIARGVGEDLEAVRGAEHFIVVLAKPQIGVSTREIYKSYKMSDERVHPDTLAMVNAIEEGDIHGIRDNMINVLEDVTIGKYPAVKALKSKFREFGATKCMMTGSGPTVYALFTEKERGKAESLYRNLLKNYKQAYMVRTFNDGWEL